MSVDYLSALNSKGSGLNITQIVDSLVQAETAPQKELLQDKIDTRNTAISALATLSSELATQKQVFQASRALQNMRPPAPARAYNFRDQHLDRRSFYLGRTSNGVGNLTNPRIFRLHPPTQELATGSISVDFGTWSEAKTLPATPAYPQ